MVIGLVEELVKAIPFFIAILLFRPADPITLLITAGCSALAFSFAENMQYLGEHGFTIIASRGIYPTLVHIVLTSIFPFAIVYSRHRLKGSMLKASVLAWLLAALIHGTYDYFLFMESVYKLDSISALSIAMVFVLVLAYGMFLANMLNISPEFTYAKSLRLKNRVYEIIIALFAIALFEYVNVVHYKGNEFGDLWLTINALKIIVVAYLIAHLITYKDLIKGWWSWVHLRPFYNNNSLNHIFTGHWSIISDGKEYILKQIVRLPDREYQSNYVHIHNQGLSSHKMDETVLHFKNFQLSISSAGIPAMLGNIDASGKFIKFKQIRIIKNG